MKINYGNDVLETKLMFWWRKLNFIVQPLCICYFILNNEKYFLFALVLICVSIIIILAEIRNTISEFKNGMIEFRNPNVHRSKEK